MTLIQQDRAYSSLNRFIRWLKNYGETSFDYQSFYAGPIGSRAKRLYYEKPILGTLAVAPMVLLEAFFPYGRQLFWKRMRFPIADAHYAMGFAYLFQESKNQEYYEKAIHFLNELTHSRSPFYRNHCWGYPFDWVTNSGTFKAHTPYITTLPYIYEAFDLAYQIDHNDSWLKIMLSIAEHAITDIKDFEISPGVSSSAYSPDDQIGGVVNASAYRAYLLTKAYIQFGNDAFWRHAEKNINFVLREQKPNGCWYYATTMSRDFVDHIHTCFVLKALIKIEKATGHKGCLNAIERGIQYYLRELFDERGLPKPFSKAPRLTVYKKELYDYAECINLGILLKGRYKELDRKMAIAINDVLTRWQKRDGSFRSRKLLLGWDNIPMHRWGQSQLFRSLSLFLCDRNEKS